MKNFSKQCVFCSSKELYKVSSTQYKCKICKKKFSIKKLEKEYSILESFLNGQSAIEAKNTLHVNYKTLSHKYMDFRKLITMYLEESYEQSTNRFSEYDEYYYLPKNKRGRVKYLFEAVGILGLIYEEKVYTLLLPDQFSHLEDKMTNKQTNLAYMKEYSKYLNRYKIVHYTKFDNLLVHFWVFLESSLDKYKGVSREYFIYYLKECEFKFNFKKNEQKEILWKLWLNNL
jgi:transposase